jgi:hypothetical protein
MTSGAIASDVARTYAESPRRSPATAASPMTMRSDPVARRRVTSSVATSARAMIAAAYVTSVPTMTP